MAKNKGTITVDKLKFPNMYYSGIVCTCTITHLIFT